jgi:hypothetical protein
LLNTAKNQKSFYFLERVDNVLADKEIEIQLLREEMDRTREEKEALLERLRRLGYEGGAEVERRLQK